MFMAANSPLVQPRLQLPVSQGAYKNHPLFSYRGEKGLKTFFAVQVRLNCSAQTIGKLLGFFCAFHRGRRFCEFVPQCLHIPNEDSASFCTWLKPDLGLTGCTGRHVEILEVPWSGWSLIQNKHPFQQKNQKDFPLTAFCKKNLFSPIIPHWLLYCLHLSAQSQVNGFYFCLCGWVNWNYSCAVSSSEGSWIGNSAKRCLLIWRVSTGIKDKILLSCACFQDGSALRGSVSDLVPKYRF